MLGTNKERERGKVSEWKLKLRRRGKTQVKTVGKNCHLNKNVERFLYQQFKRKGLIPMERIEVECFICHKQFCQEDTDHKKMTFPQFDSLLKAKAGYEPKIAKIKHKIRKCFHVLRHNSSENLEPYVIDLFLMVDKLHFWHLLWSLNTLNDVEAAIFGVTLPRNKMIRIVDLLNEQTNPNRCFPKFDKLLHQIHKFKNNWKKVIQNRLYGELIIKFANIIQDCENQFRINNPPASTGIKTNINAGLPTFNEELLDSELVLMEGVPFSTVRRSIDLSVLELTDQSFLNCFPAIQKMKDLVQLQVRNSRLSERSYRMLFRCLPNLESLDLSNSNSDSFFKLLDQRLPKLRILYINETSLTNEKLVRIVSKLNNLKVLYADFNRISSEGVEQIFKEKKHLLYASMKGNQINDQAALKIQLNLVLKGGYLEY